MKPKTIKIIYWTVTALFALAVLQSGIVELMQTEGSKQVMDMLGYPQYLNTILGVAKILGAIAVLQPIYKTIKEWAYAGFTFDFIGAMVSGIYATDGTAIIVVPLIFLAVMFLSYFLWKKVENLQKNQTI
ncbi:MAG TPA: DoxX family protein [Balneolaceae bacterium]|nr:DoxX family protein [Balneolaceae bacterium]